MSAGACSVRSAPGPPPVITRAPDTARPPATRPTPHRSPTLSNGTFDPHGGFPGNPSDQPTSVSYADGGFVGGMALSYLRRAPATRLAVELDSVRTVNLPGTAEEHLREILVRETDKPDGVTIDRDDQLAPDGGMKDGGGDDFYTLPELHLIARAYRDADSAGSVATMHILVLDGSSEDVPGALGVAINASTMVLFAERIEDAAAPLVGANQIWRSVMVHEAGHLLGLVELVRDSRTTRHADGQHKGHSPNEDSVMYWAIEDAGIAAILGEGPPEDFDEFDRADLAALRG